MIVGTNGEYPSKVMLVGEYGVVAGGSGLSIPFHRFSAKVRDTSHIPDGKEHDAAQSIRYLKALYNYISELPGKAFHAPPDLGRFSGELEHYWLDVNIPWGYGLGSSGAVSAAIYDLFFPGSRALSLSYQREDLATIESCFHGRSSGVDALTCFSGQPLYFRKDGEIEQVGFDPSDLPGGYRFFLLDSAEHFDTGPLVNLFMKRMQDPDFASSIRNEYNVINQKLIEALLGIRDADAGMLVRVVSDYQYKHFREMIPSGMLDIWLEGQVSGEFHLKLSGPGGGFMLGITHYTSMEGLDERWKSNLIWIG